MAEIVAEFFSVIGEDMIPPDNLAELIPYLLTVLIGVALVAAVSVGVCALGGFFRKKKQKA